MLPFPPLGIGVLAGCLRRLGIDVYMDDLQMRIWDSDIFKNKLLKWIIRKVPLRYNNTLRVFRDMDAINAYLHGGEGVPALDALMREWEKMVYTKLQRVDAVGFSIMDRIQLVPSVCFAKYIKERYKVTIIMGGSFFSSKMSVLLSRFPFLDYLILGEGERALCALMQGKAPEDISNLAFRKDDAVKINLAEAEYAKNMEPDFDGLPFDLYKKHRVLPLCFELTKGCRNNCAFCVTRKKTLYFKPVAKAIEELKHLMEKYNTKYFMFVDNAINIDKSYSLEFCQALIDSQLNIKWSAYYIPDDDDADYFKVLHSAGCIQLRYGVETFGETILEKMNKKIKYQTVCNVVQNAHAAGIWNHLIFMVGHPGEKMHDVYSLARFIVQYKRFFKSAVVSPFVLGKVDMFEETDDARVGHYSDGDFVEHDLWGIRYRELRNRLLPLKSHILYAALLLSGIKIRDNFNKSKDDLERRQFLYNAFCDDFSKRS